MDNVNVGVNVDSVDAAVEVARLIQELRHRGGDRSDVEVKRAAQGCPHLGETLSSFANMPNGGVILLGLDEDAGFIPVGLPDIAKLEQAVASQARNAVTPPVTCAFVTVELEGKTVLKVDVDPLPLQDRPAVYQGRAYLRHADGDYQMSEQELAQLELLKTQAIRPTHPDRQPVPGATIDDLDPDLLAAYVGAARISSRRFAHVSDQQILQWTSVLHGESPTLAGVYALGVLPQSRFPSLSITAAANLSRGDNGRLRDLVHLKGPIPVLLDDAMLWVERNLGKTMGYGADGHGVDRPAAPLNAVRELIANALVHRNLDAITDSKRVEIRLLGDRLVISSPGGLWGVSERQLGHPGAKSAVNPVLYDMCTHVRTVDGARVIEGEGGGIREALAALEEAGLPRPKFVDTGLSFVVVVFLSPIDEAGAGQADNDRRQVAGVGDGSARAESQGAVLPVRVGVQGRESMVDVGAAPHELVLAALDHPRGVAELVEYTGLTARQVRYALKKLQVSGQVEMIGRRGVRGTVYVIVESDR